MVEVPGSEPGFIKGRIAKRYPTVERLAYDARSQPHEAIPAIRSLDPYHAPFSSRSVA